MTSTFEHQVKATIQQHQLIPRGAHVLVAVSGGADSMALLTILRALKSSLKLRLTVAHLNHRIRGRAADEDAAFVSALCRRWHIPCVRGRVDVPRLARREKISLEMAGRKARYAFFIKTTRRRHCTVIATAHTADDQAETLLLKLARGAGGQGLAGIPYVTERQGLKIVRPLRDLDRKSVEQFLRERRLAWREDATNADPNFLRNRVRHEILPLLEAKLNPRIREALQRLGNILEKENEWLDVLAREVLDHCRDASPSELNLERLGRYPLAACRRVLRLWLTGCGLPPELLDFDVTERLEALMTRAQSGRSVTLPGGYVVRRQYHQLVVERRTDLPLAGLERVRLKIPGETLLPDWALKVRVSLKAGIVKEAPRGIGVYPAWASLSAAAGRRRPLYIRHWLPGDRLAPYGLAGTKKVQDIFSDAKVPPALRTRIPLLVCGREIVWIPGYRIAAAWAVASERAPALQVRVDRLAPPLHRPQGRCVLYQSRPCAHDP